MSYSSAEDIDLGASRARQYPDPDRRLDAWVRELMRTTANYGIMEVLMALNTAIKATFNSQRREEVGVQTPVETSELGSDSGRDFAVFMLDADRCLGYAAQFGSGYLYDEKLVAAGGGVVQGEATHAWL